MTLACGRAGRPSSETLSTEEGSSGVRSALEAWSAGWRDD